MAGALLCLNSNAAEPQTALKPDNRLSELVYDSKQVFQIRVRKGTATHIVLGAGEKIILSAPGWPADCRDASADWCISAPVGASDLFIKPKISALGSNNLQLKTNKRLYSFELVQQGEAPQFRVTFRYPEECAAPAAPAAPLAEMGQLMTTEAGLYNWRYTMQAQPGSSPIAPVLAYDDGQFTYLKFADGQAIPELFVLGVANWEWPLAPLSNEGGVVKIPLLEQALVLRRNQLVVGLWNEAPQPHSIASANTL